jgi:hypothetical protein
MVRPVSGAATVAPPTIAAASNISEPGFTTEGPKSVGPPERYCPRELRVNDRAARVDRMVALRNE